MEGFYEDTQSVYMFRDVYTFSKPLASLKPLLHKAFRALWFRFMGLAVASDGEIGLWIWGIREPALGEIVSGYGRQVVIDGAVPLVGARYPVMGTG